MFTFSANEIRITKHSLKRFKERLGLSKKKIQSLTLDAIKKGVSRLETKGSLRKYLDNLSLKAEACSAFIYHEKVFIFKYNALVTILNLPNEFKVKAKKVLDGKR